MLPLFSVGFLSSVGAGFANAYSGGEGKGWRSNYPVRDIPSEAGYDQPIDGRWIDNDSDWDPRRERLQRNC